MTSAYMKRMMGQEAAEKVAQAKKDKPRKGGDRKRTELVKAPAPPPARAEVERGVAVLEKVGQLAEAPSNQGENLNTAIDRITFSAPSSEGWPRRLEERRVASGYRSTSETVRALLEEALR